ncbi:hypothetical protein BGC_17670 [Burkholderia sp. 3C]
MAVARFDQVRQERLGAVHHAPEIHAHQPFEIVDRHRGRQRRERHAGIVEDQMDRAVARLDVARPGHHGVAVAHVHAVLRDGDTGLGAQRGRVGQAVRIEIRQRQMAAGIRQRAGEAAADARARAGDDGELAVERFHAGCFARVIADVIAYASVSASSSQGMSTGDTTSCCPSRFVSKMKPTRIIESA